MNREISDLRQTYVKGTLTLENLKQDPFEQFRIWFSEAQEAEIIEPNAMVLSTVSKEGIPSSRVVLLKEVDDDGLVFYTNYRSQKGREIEDNPNVSVVFLWKKMERQIRVSGRVEKVSRERTNSYYNSRPKESRIGAYVSEQSAIIKDRDILDSRKTEFDAKFADLEQFNAPEHWGGYKILVNQVEFWQGRPSRLHDRLRFTKQGKDWQIDRLAP